MDITIKGVENVTEAEVKEWVAILVERKENAKIQAIPALVTAQGTAKVTVDTFRKANALKAKYEAVEAVEEVEKVA